MAKLPKYRKHIFGVPFKKTGEQTSKDVDLTVEHLHLFDANSLKALLNELSLYKERYNVIQDMKFLDNELTTSNIASECGYVSELREAAQKRLNWLLTENSRNLKYIQKNNPSFNFIQSMNPKVIDLQTKESNLPDRTIRNGRTYL